MNVSSQPIVLPTAHRRRFLTTTRTPMFLDASPVAVSNKIRAIQARRTRLNPVTNSTTHTDIRPLNFGANNAPNNCKGNVTVWTAERLVDRSKDIRLDRIHTRRSGVSTATTTINQISALGANCSSSAVGNKQVQANSNSTIVTPPAISSIKNKSPGGKISELPRRRTRPPLIDQQNSPILIEFPQKNLLHCPIRTINHISMPKDIVEEEVEELILDKEFEEYLQRAMIKCADWLLKYVFIETKN